MSFKRINNITGWVVCIIACAVYLKTMEATGSFWDCGEFASSAFKLQIPHSPGAPFFVLVGRLFMAPFDPAHAATGLNTMSALASGFTILFLFWTITYFAKKIIEKQGEELSTEKIIGIMAAGVVGALAYTFSDTFWYSAVESEVYALASMFTALLFWCMIKWEQDVTKEHKAGMTGHFTKADRWIILIFFLMGLSIGVHLLNLLTIPAIVMIYYFKRYKATAWKTFFAFIVSCIITGLAQKALIQWSVGAAGSFDVFFVNSLGLPFFTGFGFFFLLLVALIFGGLYFAHKNNWNLLKLGLWSFLFIILGCFGSYFTTLVRSNSNVSIDMNEVDNPINLKSYVSRDQYGDWPILFGQDFTAQIQDSKTTDTWIKGKDKYEKLGKKVEYIYDPADIHFFPRMWDQSNEQGHADYYANWAGIGKNKDGTWERAPTMAENIGFFMSYQVNWMYWRYFMWNFAGKQNDLQGIYMSDVRDGNWKSGIGFIDKMRLGSQDSIPDSLKHNKANNSLYFLPFILGLLGLFYHVKRDNRNALVVGLLFLFTGLAIEFYLNMAGNQPRERDYAFVGSFYAFAIWIGLGVLYVKELLMSAIKNPKIAAYTAGAVCLLLVPVIMANQEWDDHDRSNKVLARDLAIDYLESCAPNAILITFGDNDTYPLWYAQEVQGIRTDVRVINSSLLGTDWYINQLRYKVNDSNPIDPIWTPAQMEGSRRDIIYNAPLPGIDPNKPMDLYNMMKNYAGSDDPAKTQQTRDGDVVNVFPSKNVSVPVDVNFVRQNGTVNANDSVLSEIDFTIPKNVLYKNDAAILNIIAANKWKRPIYFTSPYEDLGFRPYLRQDGLSYRLVPVKNQDVNKDWVMDKMMKKFVFGNANKPGVYFDEENRRHLNSIRLAYAQAAVSLAESGRKEEAKKLLHKCDDNMLDENFSYGMVSRGQQQNQISLQFLYAAYLAGDTTLAEKVTKSLKKDMEQQVVYYQSLDGNKRDVLSYEEDRNNNLLKALMGLEQQFKNPQQMVEDNTPISTTPVTTPAKDSPKK
jgi:hypothetical protein